MLENFPKAQGDIFKCLKNQMYSIYKRVKLN